MEVWAVIFGVVFALVFLQVAVYRYFRTEREPLVERERSTRGAATDEDGRTREPGERFESSAAYWAATGDATEDATDRSHGRHCPHCGTENEPEPGYTFCWNCAGRLA